MNEKIVGKGGISAKIIADSLSHKGARLITWEIEVHRFVWSEFMTHRTFSRNAASSRAIPVAKQIEMVRSNPATPISWGMNQPGMQASAEAEPYMQYKGEIVWRYASQDAANAAEKLANIGFHKQICNRLLEPFIMMKAVVSSTMSGMDNFYALRLHEAADPHMHELARVMKETQDASVPDLKGPGDWHLPYAEDILDIQTAIKISVSCCAQVSYRNLDQTPEKALAIYERLAGGVPAHASPFEHQASAAYDGNIVSGNFVGWLQNRKILGL